MLTLRGRRAGTFFAGDGTALSAGRLAAVLRAGAVFFATAFFAAGLRAGAFFATTFFDTVFFAAGFFAAGLRAVVFPAAALRVVTFFLAAFVAGRVVVFFRAALVAIFLPVPRLVVARFRVVFRAAVLVFVLRRAADLLAGRFFVPERLVAADLDLVTAFFAVALVVRLRVPAPVAAFLRADAFRFADTVPDFLRLPLACFLAAMAHLRPVGGGVVLGRKREII